MGNATDLIDGGGRVWRLPQTKMLPNVPDYFSQGYPDAHRNITDTGIRFLFFRGWVNDSEGNTYPLATHDDLLTDGSSLSPVSYLMQWDGANGLYEKCWKKYVAWMQTAREVEMKWKLDALRVANLDMRKKAFVNGVHYFIKTVEIEFPITAPAIVTAVKISGTPPPPYVPPFVLYIIEKSDSSDGITCDGRLALGVTGGTAPFIFDLSGMSNLDGIYDNLCPGTYLANVIDDVGEEADSLTIIIA